MSSLSDLVLHAIFILAEGEIPKSALHQVISHSNTPVTGSPFDSAEDREAPPSGGFQAITGTGTIHLDHRLRWLPGVLLRLMKGAGKR